jgi:hypothetical protein
MSTTPTEFISFASGKCWDGGWLILIGKVHGGVQVYIPLALNHGCSVIARPWVGRYVEVMLNGDTFTSTLRAKKKSALVVPLPWSLRGTVSGFVILKIRLFEGDGHG